MLSRVADSIYWMSRYMERAENIARFVDVNINLMLELSTMPEEQQWRPMVDTAGDGELFESRYGTATEENVIRFLTFDEEYPNSILSCLRFARENARSVRETISSEMWMQVNRSYQFVREAARSGRAMENASEFFTEARMNSHLFHGITEATMTQSDGWHFGRMGTMIERADKTSRILDVKYYILLPDPELVGSTLDKLQWAALLKSASALEMYRKRHHQIAPKQVMEFLILDRVFPRAIHHCLIKAEESLRAITGTPAGSFTNSAERILGRLRADFGYTTVDDIMKVGAHEFHDDFQIRLNAVGEAIFHTFMALRPIMPSGHLQHQTMNQ